MPVSRMFTVARLERKVKVLVAQLCPALCNPTNWSLPGSSVRGSLPSPGDLPDPGIKPGSPVLQANSFLTM